LINCAVFDGADGVQGLQFHHDLAVADEIDRIGHRQETIPIAHREPYFADKRDALFLKLDRERLSTHSFQKSAPQCPMDRHRRANDLVGLRIVEFFSHDVGQFAYGDPDRIASLSRGHAEIDRENRQVASITASKLRVLVTSGAGREAAGRRRKADWMKREPDRPVCRADVSVARVSPSPFRASRGVAAPPDVDWLRNTRPRTVVRQKIQTRRRCSRRHLLTS